MPWPTTTGSRILDGAEAELVLGAIGMMVDMFVAESRGEIEQVPYEIEWFDQWDTAQRLWLLEQITRAMFSRFVITSPAAIFDAAADAIFHEIRNLIQIELDDDSFSASTRSWRQSVTAARAQQTGRSADGTANEADMSHWSKMVTRIADQILGIRLYQRAEAFRDSDYSQTQRFLQDRGLPSDYLDRIPELRSVDQTQLSIDRIQAYVFR